MDVAHVNLHDPEELLLMLESIGVSLEVRDGSRLFITDCPDIGMRRIRAKTYVRRAGMRGYNIEETRIGMESLSGQDKADLVLICQGIKDQLISWILEREKRESESTASRA